MAKTIAVSISLSIIFSQRGSSAFNLSTDIGTNIYFEFIFGDSSNMDKDLENKIIDTYVPPT